MLIKTKTIQLKTDSKTQLFDLTEEVEQTLKEVGLQNGTGTISTLHTTTGVFCTESQAALWDDVKVFLSDMIKERTDYKHNDPRFSDCDRHNAAAHLRAILLGRSLALQIEDGCLVLGQFQRIIFAELDGPRSRSVRIQLIGQ